MPRLSEYVQPGVTFVTICPSCDECVSTMITIFASGWFFKNLPNTALDFCLEPSSTFTTSSCEMCYSVSLTLFTNELAEFVSP